MTGKIRRSVPTATLLLCGALLGSVDGASAQTSPMNACGSVDGTSARAACLAAAQVAASLPAPLVLSYAGGNPTLGTASTRGVRLGLLPSVGGTLRFTGVRFPVPDVTGSGADPAEREHRLLPVVAGDVAVGLFGGFSVSPALGGVGSVDLLGSVAWTGAELVGVDGVEDAPVASLAAGARIGLLRETFTVPGVALSVMRREVGTLRYGDVCRGSAGAGLGVSGGPLPCAAEGDRAGATVDVSAWTGRLVVSKRILDVGLSAGVGLDRVETEVERLDFRYALVADDAPATVEAIDGGSFEEDRWSAFADLSWPLLIGSLTAEAGWMEGGEAVPGFATRGFDAGEGAWFGSLGVRLAF